MLPAKSHPTAEKGFWVLDGGLHPGPRQRGRKQGEWATILSPQGMFGFQIDTQEGWGGR